MERPPPEIAKYLISRRGVLIGAGVAGGILALGAEAVSAPPANADGGYRQPLDEPFEYRDRFGMRWHPIRNEYRMHEGQDYGKWNGDSWSGAPIRSIGPGFISAKGSGDARGNYVHVKHPDGHTSVYMHMLGPSPLTRGASVSTGTVIGAIGNTGGSTGAHLHLEVRTANWTAIDPIAFINNNPGTTDPVTPPPPQYWKDSTMRLIGSTSGPVYLVGPGGSAHVTSRDHVALLQRVLNSDPAAYDTFTPEQTTVIDQYMRRLAGPQTNGVTLLKTTDGKAFLAGPGGTVHILNPNDLSLIDRYLKSSTSDIDTFTVGQKDVINGYLVQLTGN